MESNQISEERMLAQSRTLEAYFLYVCRHKQLPPQDSLIMRHFAQAWSSDPLGTQHIGLCHKGIDLIREAVQAVPKAPVLTVAIEAFEVWLRADEAHRATFLMIFEMDEAARSYFSKRGPDPDPETRPLRDECLRIERELYLRHRYGKFV